MNEKDRANPPTTSAHASSQPPGASRKPIRVIRGGAQRMWGFFKTHPVWAALVVTALVGFWHFGAIHNEFYFDDQMQILEGQLNRSWDNLGTIFTSEVWRNVDDSERLTPVDTYRPLFNLSLLIDHQIAGLRPTWYHAVNLLIHLINVWLIFWVGRRIVGDAPALVASLFFGVHPATLTCVHYVSSRPDSSATLFVLLTAGLALRAHQRFPRHILLLATSFLAALLCKETAIIALVAVPLLYWTCDTTATPRRALILFAALFAAATLYFALRINALHATKIIETPSHAVLILLSYPMVLFHWLKTSLLLHTPMPLQAFSPLIWPLPPVVLALVIATYTLLTALGFFALFKRQRVAALLIWSLMGIAPPLAAMVRTHIIDGHYFYPTAPGLALLLGLLLHQPFWNRAAAFWRPLLAALLIICAAARSETIAPHFRTEISFYRAITESGPHSHIATYNLANAHRRAGQIDIAIAQYQRVLRDHSQYADAKAHNNLSLLLLLQGQFDQAETHARKAAAANPNNARYHYNLAVILAKQQRWTAFGDALSRALHLDPQHQNARGMLAQFCASRHRDLVPALCPATTNPQKDTP